MIEKLPLVGTLWCGALLVAAALLTPSKATLAQTPSSVMRGQAVAERACAGCHSTDGSQGGGVIKGIPVPSFRAIAARRWTSERLQAFIATPHRPMPATSLDLAEIRDVVAYIQSLR